MKGFYWGDGMVHCSFCGQRHHNITTCALVTATASQAMHKLDTTPNYILSRDEHKALYEIKRRVERKHPKEKRKRSPPRCSYCRSTSHKRPKCESLGQLRQLVYKANKNWKRLFVQRVNECGLGIGALIEMKASFIRNLSVNIEPNGIAMITGYNIKDLNVFCALDAYSQYQSNSTFQIMSGEYTENLSIKFLSMAVDYNLLARGWWYGELPPKVLNPMAWKPDKEWLNSEWDEIMDWFFKDAKKFDLQNTGVMDFIEKWANKI